MKFYGREKEILQLKETQLQSLRNARFTIVTGRRRSGKTSLLLKAHENTENMLYFFVSRKAEGELCRDFAEEITEKLDMPVLGEVQRFSDIFRFLMDVSKRRPITLIIDEFQDFKRVNPSIFSDMQKIWDLNKGEAHMNLIVCGSVFSLMNVIFKNNKEPLYGRQTGELRVEPFGPATLKTILTDHHAEHDNDDLLALYSYTGGVAEYVELLMDAGATDKQRMTEHVMAKNSYFIQEGKNMLIEEFGRDYGRYFEILSLIAQGHTTRSRIENVMKVDVGGYLLKLEEDYSLISRKQPLFAKTNRNIHYEILDNFLRFWFRYIYRYAHIIEANAIGKLKTIVERDYTTYTGHVLEHYFKAKMRESEEFTRIGSWWDRKGENEIDIIAADELEKRATFCEVKRQSSELRLSELKEKVNAFLEATGKFKRFDITLKGLSLEDM